MLDNLLRIAPVVGVYLFAAALFCVATARYANTHETSILLGDDDE